MDSAIATENPTPAKVINDPHGLYGCEIFSYVLSPESLRGAEGREHLILLFLACHDFDFNLEQHQLNN
jgi:hypothetical protein